MTRSTPRTPCFWSSASAAGEVLGLTWDDVDLPGEEVVLAHQLQRVGGELADLDVHPRVAMAIFRHAQIAVTMEVYTQASSKATREALRRLSDSLAG